MADANITQLDLTNYRAKRDKGVLRVTKPVANSKNYIVMSCKYSTEDGTELEPQLANINDGTIASGREYISLQRAAMDKLEEELNALADDMNKL